jgi:hypothetical protein
MNPLVSENGAWIPRSKEDKEKVRQQMNRLLETSHFKNSKRYPLLLRFIVEETLEGRGEFLKERLIGIRVFDRPADYDTAEDPVVRVTIAEIRKRIAQYYYEEAHDAEMRIELLPGRYVPEFRPSKDMNADHHQTLAHEYSVPELPQEETAVELAEVQSAILSTAPLNGESRFSWLVLYTIGALIIVLLAGAAGITWRLTHPAAIDEMWKPFLANRGKAVFCLPIRAKSGVSVAAEAGILVGDNPATQDHTPTSGPTKSASTGALTFLDYEVLGENVVFSDLLATLHISNYLATHHRESEFRPDAETTLDDLRKGPVILVGGLDNQWTLRALSSMRYRFAGTYQEQYWIVDTKNPASREWGLNLKEPLANIHRDYAIIARLRDDATGQIEMIVAGIGMSGTAAAGEFLVDSQQMDELRRKVGPGFKDREFEAVLSMDVVNGIAGSPRILTVALR